MKPRRSQSSVMIIAGEASGDLHGANLVKAMQTRHPGLFFFGIGGPQLRAAGVHIVMEASELSVVGITEVFSRSTSILRGIQLARRLLRTRRPDLLILIDFPDFNLHVAGVAKRHGVTVLYYISPQIWAWRSGRVHKIARRVDHMAVILPFEEPFYRRHNVPVTFVGHPLMDTTAAIPARGTPTLSANAPVVGLLPGSRDKEVSRLLPEMLGAARRLTTHYRDITFLVSVASTIGADHLAPLLAQEARGLKIELVAGDVRRVFGRCHVVVAASGTVTLEGALAETPMIVIYKVSALSYWMGRALIRVPHVSLVNLIAGREIIPELIQEQASALTIATTLQELLSNPAKLQYVRQALREVRQGLGCSGASARVAEIALQLLRAAKGAFPSKPQTVQSNT